MMSLWRHLSFLQRNVHISNSIEPTNFVLRTNTQQHNVHLMMKMKVTLTDVESHSRKSKVIKKWTNGHISQTNTLSDIIPRTKIQYNKRHIMTFFWPWFKVKVTTQGQSSQTWRCLRSLNASCVLFFLFLNTDFFFWQNHGLICFLKILKAPMVTNCPWKVN